jgi:hypothetical protein
MKRFALVRAVFAATLAVACGTTPDTETVLCNEFRVGADLSKTDFGVPREIAPSYTALAQATGDISVVAARMLSDVDAACAELAGGADDPRLAGKSDAQRTVATCEIAAERIAAARAKLAAAKVVLRVGEARCSVDATFQTACEASCRADASCTEATPHERCAPADREGVCTGACSGACVGTEAAPVDCAGKCDGPCFGTCDGDGTCAEAGCVCTGACAGTCGGACAAGGAATCTGRCRGGCDAALGDETCAGPLAPPRCSGDVDCQNACSASAAARADCRDGALTITVRDPSKSRPEIERIVYTLERNLPVVFLAGRGRAKLLSERASALTDAAGHLLSKSDMLGPKGAACGIVIGKTSEGASANLDAVHEASKKVTAVVDEAFRR